MINSRGTSFEYSFLEPRFDVSPGIPDNSVLSEQRIVRAAAKARPPCQERLSAGIRTDRPVSKQVIDISLVTPCVLRLRKRVATNGNAYQWMSDQFRYSITFRNLD
jgi:hypothetical protein